MFQRIYFCKLSILNGFPNYNFPLNSFNNILSPIIGCSEIARRSWIQIVASIAMDEIFQAAIRAKELVKQILTFSCQSKQELKPLYVRSILTEVLKLV
jgi:hypothetical protein